MEMLQQQATNRKWYSYTWWPWVTLKVIPLLQAFSSVICRRPICGTSRGPSASAALHVFLVYNVYIFLFKRFTSIWSRYVIY